PSNVMVIWRFFGTELYARRLDWFFSSKSIEAHSIKQRIKLQVKKNKVFNLISKYFIGGKNDALFFRAIDRIDFMLLLSKNEYQFLKERWPMLPPPIKLPHLHTLHIMSQPDFAVKNL